MISGRPWLSGLDVFQPEVAFLSPLHKPSAYWTLSTRIAIRLTAPFNDLVQAAQDAHCCQRVVHFDAQALAIEVIEHVSRPDRPTIRELFRKVRQASAVLTPCCATALMGISGLRDGPLPTLGGP